MMASFAGTILLAEHHNAICLVPFRVKLLELGLNCHEFDNHHLNLILLHVNGHVLGNLAHVLMLSLLPSLKSLQENAVVIFNILNLNIALSA